LIWTPSTFSSARRMGRPTTDGKMASGKLAPAKPHFTNWGGRRARGQSGPTSRRPSSATRIRRPATLHPSPSGHTPLQPVRPRPPAHAATRSARLFGFAARRAADRRRAAARRARTRARRPLRSVRSPGPLVQARAHVPRCRCRTRRHAGDQRSSWWRPSNLRAEPRAPNQRHDEHGSHRARAVDSRLSTACEFPPVARGVGAARALANGRSLPNAEPRGSSNPPVAGARPLQRSAVRQGGCPARGGAWGGAPAADAGSGRGGWAADGAAHGGHSARMGGGGAAKTGERRPANGAMPN